MKFLSDPLDTMPSQGGPDLRDDTLVPSFWRGGWPYRGSLKAGAPGPRKHKNLNEKDIQNLLDMTSPAKQDRKDKTVSQQDSLIQEIADAVTEHAGHGDHAVETESGQGAQQLLSQQVPNR